MGKLLFDHRNPLHLETDMAVPGLRVHFRNMQFGGGDYRIPDHAHSFFETIYYLQGKGEYYRVKDETGKNSQEIFAYKPGDLISVAPGTVHGIRPHTKSKSIFWSWEALGGDRLGSIQPSFVKRAAVIIMGPLLQSVVNECSHPQPDSQKVIINLIVNVLRAEIQLLYPETGSDSTSAGIIKRIPHSTLADYAETFIRDNFFLDIKLFDVAQQFNVGTRQMMRILKSRKPPVKFRTALQDARIKAACQLLLQNPKMKLREVASKCGFNDEYYFANVFKRVMKVAPGKFRKRQGGE